MVYPPQHSRVPVDGDIVLAADITTSNSETVNFLTPDTINDYSDDLTQMQETKDPYPGGAPSTPATLAEELRVMRYLLHKALQGEYWYNYPGVVSKVTTYTATLNDYVILGNCTGGDFTITLPTAVGNTGKRYRVVKIDTSTNILTVNQDGTETINGSTAAYRLSSRWDFVEVFSDGANWIVISTNVTYFGGFWVQFDGTGTVALAAKSSRNVASITDNGVGIYTINFINPAPNGLS